MMRGSRGTSRLQLTPCTYADDFALSGPFFSTRVLATASAFRTIDSVTGMNFNNNKAAPRNKFVRVCSEELG